MSAVLSIMLTTVVLASSHCVGDQSFHQTVLTQEVICDLSSRLTSRCAEQQKNTSRSLLECAISCAYSAFCTGVSRNANGPCYHHRACSLIFSCSQQSEKLLIYRIRNQSYVDDSEQTSVPTDLTTAAVSTAPMFALATTPTEVTSTSSMPTSTSNSPKSSSTTSTATSTLSPTSSPTTSMASTTSKSTVTSTLSPTSTTTAVRNCTNKSTYDNATNTCKCVEGWVGDNCERYPTSCEELSGYGYITEWPGQLVKIKLPDFSEPFSILCYINPYFVNTFIMFNKGSYSHTKTWNDYVNGYFLDDRHFWIGLAKMKALNQLGMDRVYLDTSFYYEMETSLFQYRYDGFSMGDDSNLFRMSYASAERIQSGPYKDRLSYGNCLQTLRNASFSTPDKDNDQVGSKNCAKDSGVGWWFVDCQMSCNPLGLNYQYSPPPTSTKKYFKMDGLYYDSGEYAQYIEIYMYFQNYGQ